MNQEEMDKMFGKGENKAPFLKVLDEVFDKAEEDETYPPYTSYLLHGFQ